MKYDWYCLISESLKRTDMFKDILLCLPNVSKVDDIRLLTVDCKSDVFSRFELRSEGGKFYFYLVLADQEHRTENRFIDRITEEAGFALEKTEDKIAFIVGMLKELERRCTITGVSIFGD